MPLLLSNTTLKARKEKNKIGTDPFLICTDIMCSTKYIQKKKKNRIQGSTV